MSNETASLRRWRPRTWTPECEKFETFDTSAEGGDEPILVDMDEIMENRDLATLYRAVENNGWAKRLFRTDPALAGTSWYDRLERMCGMSVECRIGKQAFTLHHERESSESEGVRNALEHDRVESITVDVTLRRGNATRTVKLETDFAVADEYDPNPVTAAIVFRGDFGKIDIDELTGLVHDAVFEPGDDEDDDSLETQLEDSRQNAHHAACNLLLDEASAESERIRYAVQLRIAHLIPEGRTVRIVKHPGIEAVEVDVSRT